MRRGEFTSPDTHIWYFDSIEELKQSEKRYKENGIPTKWIGKEEVHISVPDSVTLIYKLDPIYEIHKAWENLPPIIPCMGKINPEHCQTCRICQKRCHRCAGKKNKPAFEEYEQLSFL